MTTNEREKMETTENDYYTRYDKPVYDAKADLQDALDRANAHIKRLQNPDITHENSLTTMRNEISAQESSLSYLRPQINKALTQRQDLTTYLTENYDDMGDHAVDIAEIFDISLTKEATFNVVMNVRVTVEVPLGDVDTVEDFISDNLSVESMDSDVQVEDYSVYTCEEE